MIQDINYWLVKIRHNIIYTRDIAVKIYKLFNIN